VLFSLSGRATLSIRSGGPPPEVDQD